MENRINSRVIIAVNKRNKLLRYLRKLNSGEIEAVSVKMVHTPKEKPINLLFVGSGAEDNFLVYYGYGKPESKKVVVLGSAIIKSLWSTGFTSADNKESKECVAINVYTKGYALDFKELQDVLFSIQRLSTYGSVSTLSAMLVELKPENKRIIRYEVSILQNNPLESSVVKKTIDSVANNCDIENKAHEYILEIKIPARYAMSNEIKKMSALALNLGSVVEISSSNNEKEIRLYLKDKENSEPLILLLRLEQSQSLLNGIVTKSIMAYTLDSKEDREILLGHCNISSHLQNIQISISFIKEHNLKYEVANFIDKISTAKNTKIVYLNVSPVSSHKANVISLDTNDIKSYIIIDKANELNNPLYSSAAKKATDSAVNTKPQYICHSKDSNSTVTEGERYMLEKRHMLEALKRMHNTDSRKSYNIESELVIALSILRSDLEKPLKRWKKILKAKPTEVLTDTSSRVGYIVDFYIRESSIRVGRGANTGLMTGYELVAKYSLDENVVSRIKKNAIISGLVFKALNNAYAEYKQRKSENLNISHLESLLKENQKTNNQERDKDLIGIIAESLREIGSINKTSANKCSKTAASEDLFCKKAKASSKKDNNTTQPYRIPNPIPNPVVTILASNESKNKVKEIIEEANKTKSFPYKLDYNNDCVVRISDNLFDILECKNKLEDILKIRKDIDVGIFALEPTEGLVFKKLFNISSLTVYHSASKNLYALIGIY